MDSRLQSQQFYPMSMGVVGHVPQHQLRKTRTAELRADIHPLDLGILAAYQLDCSTARWNAALTNDKEGHTFREQFLHAVAMPAFARIEGLEQGVQFVDQCARIDAVGPLGCDDG